MKKNKNKEVDAIKVINEMKENLIYGTPMPYVKSLKFDKNYKEKEINKYLKQIKKQRIKQFIKKLFHRLDF